MLKKSETMQNTTRPQSFCILLFPQFSNHCLANTVEPLRAANMLYGAALYRWRYLALDAAPVVSSSGLPVQPEALLRDDPGGDALLVMPSYGVRGLGTPACLSALRAARRRFRQMIGLDTGSWLLAAAGLLDGRRATIHWDELINLAEAYPQIDVVDDRFVLAPDLASCGGVGTALDLMLEIIGRDHGPLLKMDVAALFMQGDPPKRPMPDRTAERPVLAVLALMRRHVEAPLPLPDIAARLGLGLRRMERAFQAEMGRTPRAAYRWVRLTEAKRLTRGTTLGMAEIAARCGYQDASAMTRAFRAEFGATPRDMRNADAPPR